MKQKKLILKKLKISRLNNLQSIIGGNGTASHALNGCLTDVKSVCKDCKTKIGDQIGQ